MANRNVAEERHVLAVLVDNEPGVLARVVGLFSGRGYNIETLTVAAERLVPVREVHDLTDEGPHVAHEVALVKIENEGPERREALRIADIFRARVVDTGVDSFVFSLTGAPEKVDSFLQLMRNLGETEISRSGVVALRRGDKDGVPNLGAGSDDD
jgi:acetolactate synthase-1/3 small subunit